MYRKINYRFPPQEIVAFNNVQLCQPQSTVVKGEEKENNLAEPDVKQQETEKPKTNPHANHKM